MPAVKWSVIACISSEERWSAALATVIGRDALERHAVLQVAPTATGRAQEEAIALMQKATSLAVQLVGDAGTVHTLAEPTHKLADELLAFASDAGPNILIDITCFPKRFFFPIVKLLTESKRAANIVVTYTHAREYPSGRLAEDPEPSRPLPMFTGALVEEGPTTLLLSTGVEALGLSQLVESESEFAHIKVLFPFPAPPPLGQRNWDVLRMIHQARSLSSRDVIGVDVNDVPRTFAQLEQVGGKTPQGISLAPFGAKPVSLAMCLYALSAAPERRPAVLYTQPRRYNPRYSLGVRERNGRPLVTAYVIRLGGRHLYPQNA